MENMRDLLRSSLGRALRELDPIDRLTAAWTVAAGSPTLAAHGTIVAYVAATATVEVEIADPIWLDHLRSLREPLARDLARIADLPVRAIHFEDAAARRRRLANQGRPAVIPSAPRDRPRGRR